MYIKLKSLKLYGFMSFENAELSFDKNGYTLISGCNNNPDDNAKSNGSGKSSLISDSIVWALTGVTTRGTKQIVNQNLNKGAFVELTFDIDKDHYKIIRSKEHKDLGTNLKIYINNEDKSGKGIRDSEKLLSDYLPDLNSNLISSIMILGQGLPQKFTSNTPAGRKEILEKLTKSDFMIEDIKDKLAKRKSELSVDLRQLEDLILNYSSKKEVIENQLIKLKNNKALLSYDMDYDADIKKNEKILYEMTTERDKKESQKEIYSVNLNLKSRDYDNWISQINNNIQHEQSLVQDQLTPYFNQVNSLRMQLDLKNKEIKRLESITDICPTCGQKLPDIHKVDTTDIKKERDNLISILEQAKLDYESMKNETDQKLKFIKSQFDKDTQEIYNEVQEARKLYDETCKVIYDYNKEINNIKLTIDKIKINKENYEKQKQTIDNDIKLAEQQLLEFSDKILYNNIEKDKTTNHMDIVNKMISLANRDFRGVLLSNIISLIDLKAKEYAQYIFNHQKVSFQLNDNNIDILYCDRPYENISGGEARKLDVLVQLSLKAVLSDYLNINTNVLILDEIFDSLDDIGCSKIIDLISNKLNYIENIYIITHRPDLQIPYDNEITVYKNENGISEIK